MLRELNPTPAQWAVGALDALTAGAAVTTAVVRSRKKEPYARPKPEPGPGPGPGPAPAPSEIPECLRGALSGSAVQWPGGPVGRYTLTPSIYDNLKQVAKNTADQYYWAMTPSAQETAFQMIAQRYFVEGGNGCEGSYCTWGDRRPVIAEIAKIVAPNCDWQFPADGRYGPREHESYELVLLEDIRAMFDVVSADVHNSFVERADVCELPGATRLPFDDEEGLRVVSGYLDVPVDWDDEIVANLSEEARNWFYVNARLGGADPLLSSLDPEHQALVFITAGQHAARDLANDASYNEEALRIVVPHAVAKDAFGCDWIRSRTDAEVPRAIALRETISLLALAAYIDAGVPIAWDPPTGTPARLPQPTPVLGNLGGFAPFAKPVAA